MPDRLREQLTGLVAKHGLPRVWRALEAIASKRHLARQQKVPSPKRIQKPRAAQNLRPDVERLLAMHREGTFLRSAQEYRHFLSYATGVETKRGRASLARLRAVLEQFSDEQLAGLAEDARGHRGTFDEIVRSIIGHPRSSGESEGKHT